MQKPTPQPREAILEYSDCVQFIESKLGYKIRDTLGKFSGDGVADVEYRDWWHFLINNRSVNNPCEITIGSDLLESGEGWQNEITQAFIDEFGDGAEYHVWW